MNDFAHEPNNRADYLRREIPLATCFDESGGNGTSDLRFHYKNGMNIITLQVTITGLSAVGISGMWRLLNKEKLHEEPLQGDVKEVIATIRSYLVAANFPCQDYQFPITEIS